MLTCNSSARKQPKPIWGQPLDVAVKIASIGGIPLPVYQAVEFLENQALNIEGIFRISGNLRIIDSLKKRYDAGETPNLMEYDAHVVSGMLKNFFSSLPNPLMTYELYEHFLAAQAVRDQDKRLEAVKSLLMSLPEDNRNVLRFLVRHLQQVVLHSETNRMTLSNVSIVFGPTLFRSNDDSPFKIMKDTPLLTQLVQSLIRDQDYYFGSEPVGGGGGGVQEANRDEETEGSPSSEQQPELEPMEEDEQKSLELQRRRRRQQLHQHHSIDVFTQQMRDELKQQIDCELGGERVNNDHFEKNDDYSPVDIRQQPPPQPSHHPRHLHHNQHTEDEEMVDVDTMNRLIREVVLESMFLSPTPSLYSLGLSIVPSESRFHEWKHECDEQQRRLESIFGIGSLDAVVPSQQQQQQQKRDSIDYRDGLCVLKQSPEQQQQQQIQIDDAKLVKVPTLNMGALNDGDVQQVPSIITTAPKDQLIPSPASLQPTAPLQMDERQIQKLLNTEHPIRLDNPLPCILKRLEVRRQHSRFNRVNGDIMSMTLDEMRNEKSIIKKELRQYDKLFEEVKGREPSKQDKEPLREIYQRYKQIKVILDKNSLSPSSALSSSATASTTASLMDQQPNNRLSPSSAASSSPTVNPIIDESTITTTTTTTTTSAILNVQPNLKYASSSPRYRYDSKADLDVEETQQQQQQQQQRQRPQEQVQQVQRQRKNSIDSNNKLNFSPQTDDDSNTFSPPPPSSSVATAVPASLATPTTTTAAAAAATFAQDEFLRLKSEKRELQKRLHQYQDDFYRKYGRKVKFRADRQPMESEYERYKFLKARLKELEVLQQQQQRQRQQRDMEVDLNKHLQQQQQQQRSVSPTTTMANMLVGINIAATATATASSPSQTTTTTSAL